MSTTIGQIAMQIDAAIPLRRAAVWDVVGLQVGDRSASVGTVAVCHEVTPAVVESVANVDVLISYHPLLFAPLSSLTAGPSVAGRVLDLVRSDTALFVVHTAFDVIDGGCADALADSLSLIDVESFGSGLDAAGDPCHVGRLGRLSAATQVEAFAQTVRQVLGTPVRTAGPNGLVQDVAVVPGSGGDFLGIATELGVDAVVTGDVSHHKARAASDRGLVVIDAGHVPTERPGLGRLYSLICAIHANTVDLTHIDPHPWRE